MNAAEIKLDLQNKIENAGTRQLKDIYGLVINYLNNADVKADWNLLSEHEQIAINKGFEQAEAGLGKTLKETNQRLRGKYGINN